ncbi:hypothetical protein DY000_02037090 [Brassica cretica]|uniref:F-box domain-containing protein n=1 Tax=Brassica cretica TaxID=69181 RepID=A0ABQ7BGM5_BRACR|nr:hypothetical protein DY000_02037090 [Brassica cretica]
MISEEGEPTQKKKKIPEPLSSLSSLPHEITENILARVSRWKYPCLSLVCKSFRSLLSPLEIYKTRSQIGVKETCVYICLELPDQPCASWFNLWTKPNKKRNKRRGKTKFKRDSSGNSVVQIPFSSSPSAPLPYETQTVGSEIYIIGGPDGEPSSSVRILDCRSHTWRDGPNMTIDREDAPTALLDEKIYVVGGCNIDMYSTNWIDVFDIRTQSWTALPGPGPDEDDELVDDYRALVNVFEGKIYLATDEKDYTYDPKDGTWKLVKEKASFVPDSVMFWCEMDNVLYCCTDLGYLMWSTSEIEGREWREIKGLDKLRKHLKTGKEIEMANYGGMLLVMWHSYPDFCIRDKICLMSGMSLCYKLTSTFCAKAQGALRRRPKRLGLLRRGYVLEALALLRLCPCSKAP